MIKNSTIDWKDKNIAVLGAGKTGISVSKLAKFIGANVLLSDSNEKNIDNVHIGIKIEVGGHSNKILENDLIIKSPGIPNDIPILIKAREKKIKIISEIEFSSWFSQLPIIGITGSNGKTTTVNLLNRIFKDANFNPALGGNMGIPFSDNVMEELLGSEKIKLHILELSSFQLEHIFELSLSIACILNISEDHLDRYKNMSLYIDAKLKIIDFSDKVLYDSNDPILFNRIHRMNKSQEVNSEHSIFKILNNAIYSNKKEEIMFSLEDTNFIGSHNLLNALNACTLASLYGVSDECIVSAMKKIKPLSHRLELVADLNSIKFYNDSKSTNINSTIKALESFNENIILILGGINKGSEFRDLKANLGYVKNIYCYGKSGQEIASSLKDYIDTQYIYDFSDCVKRAINGAVGNDNVLLSPACASFDQFNNFEERGELFRKIVMEKNNV